MKLTLKGMLLATLCCVLITGIEFVTGTGWTSPRDFKPLIYWIIVAVGWAVYLWERYRKK